MGEWSTSLPGRFIPPPQKKRKSPVYPLNRAGENHGGFGEEKNLLPLSLNIEEYLDSNERPLYTALHKIMKFVFTEPTAGVIHKRDTACSYSLRFKDTAYVKVGLTRCIAQAKSSSRECDRIRSKKRVVPSVGHSETSSAVMVQP